MGNALDQACEARTLSGGIGRRFEAVHLSLLAVCGMTCITACDHSVPFSTGGYGAEGPFAGPPEMAQLTVGGASGPVWTSDGKGIFYVKPQQLTILPAAGGSAIWEGLELRATVRSDSFPLFEAAAIDRNGRVLLVEAVAPKPRIGTALPFPVGYKATLWLSDTASHLSNRRVIGTLYSDSSGIPVVPSNQMNWLSQLTWTAGDTFLAIGQNLNPSGAFHTLGLFRGVITAGATNFTQIAGTQSVQRFGITGRGASAVYSDTGLTVWRVATAGGAPEILATLPFESGRVIADLSCRAELCVVLTLEGPPQFPGFPFERATIWKVSLDTGALSQLRQFTAPIPTALSISPVNGDLAILKSGQLWLSKGFLL